MTRGWPAKLSAGEVTVRPLTRHDRDSWVEVRLANQRWLQPWEATPVGGSPVAWDRRHTPEVFSALLRNQRKDARAGKYLPFGVFYGGRFCGQVNVTEVTYGAFWSGYLGYWIDERVAGRGIGPTAVALVADHAFAVVGLHRLEANVRPENTASLALIRKLGFRLEGERRSYLVIDGAWRDHLSFALLADDFPVGVLAAYSSATGGKPVN